MALMRLLILGDEPTWWRQYPRARRECAKIASVVTSRPAAFANSPGFDTQLFLHIELGSVRRPQIDQYASLWMDVRNCLNAREREEYKSILNEKLDQPHLRDLARNPMQLTILLSLILTRGAALPDKRTSLYDAYIDLFFSKDNLQRIRLYDNTLNCLRTYTNIWRGYCIHPLRRARVIRTDAYLQPS